MNLNHLATFHAVAEEGSISRGAARLFISQPAVSKQVRELEASLGVILLDRLPRGVQLTEAGEVLASHARRLFAEEADAERAIAELKGLSKGRLVLGASLTIGVYLLPEILGLYRKKHPGVELSLEIGNTQVVQQKVLDNAVDIALTEGFVEHKDLEGTVASRDELVAIVATDHPFAARPRLTAAEFCAEPFIMREHGSGTREVIERALVNIGLDVRPVMSLGSTEAIKRAVAAGLGVAIVSRLALKLELDADLLRVIALSDVALNRPLHIVSLRGKSESRTVQAFRSLLGESLNNGPV